MRHNRLGLNCLNEISLQDAAAFWEMKLLPGECLPVVATHALEEGYDSPSLRRLAAETETLASTLGPLFTKALAELRIVRPELPPKSWWRSTTLERFLMALLHHTKEPD
jgi:hypothetical protein